MFEKDLIMRQIQQLVAQLLRRAVELMQIPTKAEMQAILEELSGLEMSQLRELNESTLVYLMKVRTPDESRATLVDALRLQAMAEPSERWERLAKALED